MRPQSRQFTVRRCVVCGFEFSDEHHIYPRHRGGQLSERLSLCPNHHRYAHMLYQMVDMRLSNTDIVQFANAHFDTDFNELLLEYLVTEYRATEAFMDLAFQGLVAWLSNVMRET